MKKHLKLFKKDFLLQKKTIPLTIILVLGLLFVNKTPSANGMLINYSFITTVFIVSTMIVTASMIHDDKNNVLMLLSGLPIKRKSLVANKYLFTNITTILASIVMGLIFIGVDKVLGNSSFISSVYLSDIFFSIAMVNLYFLNIFPLFFKYGYAKTQMYNMVIILILMLITLIAMNNVSSEVQKSANIQTIQQSSSGTSIGIISMFISYALSYVSYKVSAWLFQTREF